MFRRHLFGRPVVKSAWKNQGAATAVSTVLQPSTAARHCVRQGFHGVRRRIAFTRTHAQKTSSRSRLADDAEAPSSGSTTPAARRIQEGSPHCGAIPTCFAAMSRIRRASPPQIFGHHGTGAPAATSIPRHDRFTLHGENTLYVRPWSDVVRPSQRGRAPAEEPRRRLRATPPVFPRSPTGPSRTTSRRCFAMPPA